MRIHGILTASILAGVLVGSTVVLKADELHVDKTAANRVRFTASFAGETFDGTTAKIDGYAFWKIADAGSGLIEGSDLYFEVDLNALDTGIGLRNHHMKENYLHTAKYPYASFKGRIVKAAKTAGADTLVNVEGVMTLHGTEKPLAVTGRVSAEGDRWHLMCAFPLDLRDFRIEVPSMMGMKVGKVMNIDLDVSLKKVK